MTPRKMSEEECKNVTLEELNTVYLQTTRTIKSLGGIEVNHTFPPGQVIGIEQTLEPERGKALISLFGMGDE